MKFKVGDKVAMFGGHKWNDGSEYKTIESCDFYNGESRYRLNDISLYWFDNELELYKEPQTEFTFTEVIARINPGEVYTCVGIGIERIESIEKTHNNDIKMKCNNLGLPNGLGVRGTTKFKLQESKKHTWIYKVEHQKNGKHCDFISSQLLQDDEFVECDTCKGRSYGKIAEIVSEELTETELKQYKECWRA